MNSLPDRVDAENIIDTDAGPLRASETIFLLYSFQYLFGLGFADTAETHAHLKDTKMELIASFIQLELELLLRLHNVSLEGREFTFRKGGIIVWRERSQ